MSLIIKWKTPRPDDSSGFILWRAHNKWQRSINDVLKPFKLTHVQFMILAGLYWMDRHMYSSKRKPSISQAQLADFLDMDVMMMSVVSRTLEQKQFIRRKPHPKDSRAKLIDLTDDGVSYAQQAIAAVDGFDESYFSTVLDLDEFNTSLKSLLRT